MPIEISLNRNTDNQNYVFGVIHLNIVFELSQINLQIEQLIPNDTALIAINDFITKTDTIDIN